jgi:serine phosphatase RsbU (regulator of sigma subunit)
MHASSPLFAPLAGSPGPDRASLDALAEATRGLAGGGSLADALARVAEAAARGGRADLVLVRAGEARNGLVARALWARSGALAAELEGTRLAAAELESGERQYDFVRPDEAPAAVRRAALLAGADRALVVPVGAGPAAGTVELYREGEAFDEAETALARLAAAQVELALALDGSLDGTDAAAERTRLSLELAGEALASGSDERELAEHVVRLVAGATGAARTALWRIEPDARPVFLAAHGDAGLPPADADAIERALEQRDAAGTAAPEDGRTIVVPLGAPPAGALELAFAGPDGGQAAEAISAFAARTAVALRRTRRAQLVVEALERSQTVFAVVSQAIAQLSLAHTLDTAVERISELTDGAPVGIYLREGERFVAAASRGLAGDHPALAERLLELALGPSRARGFVVVPDLRRDRRLAGLDEAIAEAGVRRALVLPLAVGDEVIGALAVFGAHPRPYRAGEEGLLIALSSQLAVAVQNARLHERTKQLGAVLERTLASERRTARQLRGLWQITTEFTRTLSLEGTLDVVASTMVELLGVDAAVVRMPDGRRENLVTRSIRVADPALHAAAAAVFARPRPIDDPHFARVVESRESLLAPGRDSVGVEDPFLGPFLAKGATAAIVPLVTPGEVVGVLTLISLDPSKPLDADALETLTAVTAQAALAIDNARLLEQQRDFTETMQRSLLPRSLPEVPGLEIGHVYESSSRVEMGGDVYDVLPLEDGRVAVCLGDVVGKGIEAAADMAMAKFSFRALARSHPEPGAFLAAVNEVVVDEIAPGKFLTMVYAVLDPATGALAAANAGHPPLRLVRPGGRVRALPAPGLALGIEGAQSYEEERASVPPGASVVLFTDGVLETRHEGELYGEARLDAFLAANAGLEAQALADALVADVRAFGGGELDDDCAVVCLRLAP